MNTPAPLKSEAGHLLVIGLLFAAAVIAVNLMVDQFDSEAGRGTALNLRFYCGAILFWSLPVLAVSQGTRLRNALDQLGRLADGGSRAVPGHRLVSLFIVSFAVLFIETMLIRYIGSQTRIFAYYKNIPLIGAFLGLGIGCFRGKGGGPDALLFLAGMVMVALFFAAVAQAIGAVLGVAASAASTESVFGYFATFPVTPATVRLIAHVHIALYCAAVFLALAWLFERLGRILGASFDGVPRLQAYSVNIVGSLAGLAAFVGCSTLHTAPWLWSLIGLAPLLWWLGRGRARTAGLALIASTALVLAPTMHHTIWSSYQKLTGRDVPHGYQIDISDAFYQLAFDLRPETVAALGANPMPHYDVEFAGVPRLDRVLVVGAGSGNDVATALRAGAAQVDAVEIDGAIVDMGREHHPEHPYDDPRVRVIIDDARHAFKTLPPQSYDVVVFGTLDSHTQLGTSSVRLDNYVFTQESFSAAARLVKPGGRLTVSALTAPGWFRERYATMLSRACGAEVEVSTPDTSTTYICTPTVADPDPSASGVEIGAPVDDWPFPYLPDRSIPLSYGIVILVLMLASIYWLRRNGIAAVDATAHNGHMFFLGAAFLLMEVYAINRLALLFGTTWVVSAVSIAAILIEILAANLVVGIARIDLRPYAYVALAILLPAGWLIGPEIALGQGTVPGLLYALFLLSPVFCAGIVFATSFARAATAGPALGANILGAVLGGWVEYGTMATGIRFMALLALALYAGSLLCLLVASRRLAAGARRV
jgi:SAM-dependent methyltransferase